MGEPLVPADIRERFHTILVNGQSWWNVSGMVDEIITLQDQVNQLEADTKALVEVTANAKNQAGRIRAAYRDIREAAGTMVDMAVRGELTDSVGNHAPQADGYEALPRHEDAPQYIDERLLYEF